MTESRAVPHGHLRTAPATPDRWPDVVVAFGRRGEDPDWCWCRRLMNEPDVEIKATSNRDALRIEVTTAAVAPGLIAYVDDVPVGWTRITPRSAVPAVLRNRALRRLLSDDPGAWWVTCFAVDQRHRRTGLATGLLRAAVAHAKDHGASTVEGHPVDTAALKATKVSGSALFTGTMRTFDAAGFTEVGRTYPSRPIMRLVV